MSSPQLELNSVSAFQHICLQLVLSQMLQMSHEMDSSQQNTSKLESQLDLNPILNPVVKEELDDDPLTPTITSPTLPSTDPERISKREYLRARQAVQTANHDIPWPRTKLSPPDASDEMTTKLGALLQDPTMLKYHEELLLCAKINALSRAVHTSAAAKRLVTDRLTYADWKTLERTINESPTLARIFEILIGGDISVIHDTISCMNCFWPLRDVVDVLPEGSAKETLQGLLDSFFDMIYDE